MNHVRVQQQRGFTLLETLVAVLVMSVAVASALAVTSRSLQSAAYTRDQMIAAFLATEEIDLVKNIRDNIGEQMINAAYEDPPRSLEWLAALTSEGTDCTASGCDIEGLGSMAVGTDGKFTDSPVISCGAYPNGCPIYLGASGYSHNSANGAPTKFSRSIVITNVTDREAHLEVSIWAGGQKYITLRSVVTNWHHVAI